jgi:DnaJ-domain-containing protein 1
MKILLIIIGLIYVLSPYDILPDFIAGWGWLDDLILVFFLWRFIKNLAQKQSNARSFYQQSRRSFDHNKGSTERETHGADSQFKETGGSNDPYTVLSVPRNASLEEIKQAYRELANKYHPDKVLHLGDEFRELAEKRFKEIEEAYRELMPK